MPNWAASAGAERFTPRHRASAGSVPPPVHPVQPPRFGTRREGPAPARARHLLVPHQLRRDSVGGLVATGSPTEGVEVHLGHLRPAGVAHRQLGPAIATPAVPPSSGTNRCYPRRSRCASSSSRVRRRSVTPGAHQAASSSSPGAALHGRHASQATPSGSRHRGRDPDGNAAPDRSSVGVHWRLWGNA
jgi:hypothetical protein